MKECVAWMDFDVAMSNTAYSYCSFDLIADD